MNLQHRPRLALPILLTLLSIQLYTLPEWGASLLQQIFRSPTTPAGIPDWARMTIALGGLLFLGCYAIWIERTDQRRYDKTFSQFKEIERIHGFKPLPLIVMEKINPEIAGLIKQARRTKNIRIEMEDLDEEALKSVVSSMDDKDGLSNGLVFVVHRGFFIHPALVLDPSAEENGKT